MDEYQHPLLFDAKDLTEKEIKSIWRYFQKKRDSGGGDCAMIKKLGDNTYQINFKEKQDQERVLERKTHTIALPCRELHLTMTATKTPHNPESPDKPPISHSLTFTKANTKGLEKTFKMEIYLLYYLRDNHKACKLLQKQLSSIGCTVELNFDEEVAVVRGDIDKGPGGAFGAAEKLEIQVDRVFTDLTESLLCHHVFVPKQIKMLMQGDSLVTDDIKVYTEISHSVIVGEVGVVKERISILEKSLPTRKELPIVEKKFKLVEEEFSREMHAHYPEVKIHIGNTMITLEGLDKEVQSGATKLDELMKNVLEKRVKLPTDLMTFITSSGSISRYQSRFQQSLRNPVSIEVGSDLVLSSLSAGALDEALAVMMRDLSVDTVTLKGTAAVPPDLDRVKEVLIKAKNEANSRESRVEVSFIQGTSGPAETKVRLVGYTENINKLKEVLHDYQMNQVGVQEVLNLPYPEVVDCFDKILNWIDWKQTNVELKPSYLPCPCVLMSGPRCHVLKAKQDLMSALDNLTSDTLVLDGPGAQWYFQGEGKVGKDLVETSFKVLIMEQQCAHSHSMATVSNTRSLNHSILSTLSMSTTRLQCNTTSSTTNMTTVSVNKTILEIKLGSLVDEQVSVLVAPMINRKLTSTKIGKCLRAAASTMETNFDQMARRWTPSSGNVMQVDAPPSLSCSKIFFIECLPWDGVRGRSLQALSNGLRTCLDLCVQKGWTSVALPVIGPGVALKYPLSEAIQVLTKTIHQFGLSASTGSLSTIHVVIKPDYPDSEECYRDVYNHLSLNMNHGGQAIFRSLTSDLDDVAITLRSGVKLQLVFGDITNETTDAIVNTTDFVNFQSSVCRDILTVAGPHVEAALRNAKVNRGEVFETQPGSFPCKAILHLCGERDAGVIEQLVCRIIQQCERCGYKSVAIPAICAGAGGLHPSQVARAILRGVNNTASSSSLHCLTDIRLVQIKIDVFLEFKKQAVQMFPHAVINTVSVPQVAPPLLTKADLSALLTTSTIKQSVFRIVGLRRQDVDDAIAKMKDLYRAQCSTQTLKEEDLAGFTQDDLNKLKQLVEILGLCVEEDQSVRGRWTVSGLKDEVYRLMQIIHKSEL